MINSKKILLIGGGGSLGSEIGNYIPGKKIPILSEKKLFTDQPDFAILFSWHIAFELKCKLKKKVIKENSLSLSQNLILNKK